MNSAALASPDDPAAPIRRLVDANFLENPYPTYRGLREAGPLHWSNEFFGGAWLLTGYDDVATALRSPLYSARRTGGWVMRSSEGNRGELCPFQRLFSRAMLFLDAPDHTRLRRAMNVGFRPDFLRRFLPDIERFASELVDEVVETDSFDFMESFARPFPALVIARLLGVVEEEQANFLSWSDDLAAFIGATEPTPDLTRRAQVSLLRMANCFEKMLDARRTSGPVGDLTDILLQAEETGTIASGAELLAQCAMLLFAGHETTRNLLGNGLHSLLSHPSQWEKLKARPELLPGALRELLRFESPVQYTGRRLTTDVSLCGRRLRRGDLIVPLIGAANRDAARFTSPDSLDIERQEGSHLSFGHGPHVCIGASLTLLEAEVAFKLLMSRVPNLQLSSGKAAWGRNPVYRGLTSLWVHKG